MPSFFTDNAIVNNVPIEIREFLVQFVVAIAILAILWLLRKVIGSIIFGPLRRITNSNNRETDDILLNAVEGAVSYLVLGLGVLIIIALFGFEEGTRTFFNNIAMTLFAAAVFKFLYELIVDIASSPERVERVMGAEVTKSMTPIIRIGTRIVIIALAFVTIAQIWGFNVAGIVAGLGLGGLAVSLAAKDLLDDILGFMIIMGDDLFDLDEYIISPHGEGLIETIGIRSTRIRQLNQGLVVAPNGKLVNDSFTNWSRLQKRWFNFMVGVTYDSTAEQIENFVKQVNEMLKGREAVDEDSVLVLFTEYDDSSLNILIRAYINIADWSEAKAERHAVNLEIMRIVGDLDMSIAFPSRSLYLETVPPAVAALSNGHMDESLEDDDQSYQPVGARGENESTQGSGNGGAQRRPQERGKYSKGGQDAETHSVEDGEEE